MPTPHAPVDDTDAVIAQLAGPAIERLKAAAAQLQPVSASDAAALRTQAYLRLARHVAGLRLALAAIETRRAAAGARWEAAELPWMMRAAVHRERGAGRPRPGAQGTAS